MRRILLILLAIPPLVAGLAFVLHTPIVERATMAGLERVSVKLGTPVVVERVEVKGLAGVRLHRMRIGPIDSPLVTVRTLSTRLDVDALLARRIEPTLVEMDGVAAFLHGDGSLRGLADAARDALPPGIRARLEGDDDDDGAGGGGGRGRPLPELIIRRARFIDSGGAAEVVEGEMTFSRGRIKASARIREPDMGHCDLEGDLENLELTCERAVGRDLPGGLRIAGRQLEFSRFPRPAVRLSGIQLSAAETADGIGAVLGGVSAEMRLDLTADARGNRRLETRLVLPGGGQIAGRGTVHPRRVALSAKVADLQFGRAHQAVGGSMGGSYRLEIDVPGRKAFLEGQGYTKGLTVEHEALADGPVGPFDMGLRGRIDVELLDEKTRAIAVKVSGGRFEVGGVGFDFDAAVDTTPDAWTVEAHLDTGRVDGTKLAEAIPHGLLPSLQPIEARGRFGLKIDLEIDRSDLKGTVLDVDLDIARLKVSSINPRIDFEGLRDIFQTRFEMPPEKGEETGEILVRESGPNSERWTPLEQIPALLPMTVTTQEDGGFYKHGGVSLFHLRGSLVRNLERGRFVRGGSTISMQLTRNLFLNRRKTLSRKLEEVILTWLLEREFEKDELMTLYLNVVEFGPDIFGIGEASQYYFARPPLALTPAQIAWLVRLLPNPRGYHDMFEDKKLSRSMTASVNRLLKRLVVRGHMPEEDRIEIGPEDIFNEPEYVPEDEPLPGVPGLPGEFGVPDELGLPVDPLAPPAPVPVPDEDDPRIQVNP